MSDRFCAVVLTVLSGLVTVTLQTASEPPGYSLQQMTPTRDMDVLRIFFHLEKCAGTTMESVMRRNCKRVANSRWIFLGGLTFPVGFTQLNWLPMSSYSEQEKDHYAGMISNRDCLSGHFLADLPQLLSRSAYQNGRNREHFVTGTMLREPKARLVSLFFSWRLTPRTRQTGAHFGDFLLILSDFHHKDNYYVRVFCPHSMQKERHKLTQEDCDCALANLRKVTAVTVMEQFEQSMKLLSEVFGFSAQSRYRRENSAEHPKAELVLSRLSASHIGALSSLTKYDDQLYAAAAASLNAMTQAGFPTQYGFVATQAGKDFVATQMLAPAHLDPRPHAWGSVQNCKESIEFDVDVIPI